jgi:6-phosphogluconolactonase
VIIARHADAASAASALSEHVVAMLHKGIAANGAASLALPGGSTPVPLFHSLRDARLDWSRVSITLTDERWVPPHDPASNAAQLREQLLCGRAGGAAFFPLHDGSTTAAEAAARVWQSLQPMPRPFDAVVLGMGEDGHFASLFAGNPALADALDPYAQPACVAMRAPSAPAERLSLNLAALRQARRLFLLVNGAAKHELLMQASRVGAQGQSPVSALLALRHPVTEVFWAP